LQGLFQGVVAIILLQIDVAFRAAVAVTMVIFLDALTNGGGSRILVFLAYRGLNFRALRIGIVLVAVIYGLL